MGGNKPATRSAYKRLRKLRALKAGLCSRCWLNEVEDGFVNCKKCRKKRSKQSKQQRKNAKKQTPKEILFNNDIWNKLLEKKNS